MPKMVLYIDYEPTQKGYSQSRVMQKDALTKFKQEGYYIDTTGSEWLDQNIFSQLDNGLDAVGQVIVRNNDVEGIPFDPKEVEPITALAHETGHAIARFLQTKIVRKGQDARQELGILSQLFGPPPEILVAEEKEAWDLAHKTGLPIDSHTEEITLKSYTDALKKT
jgi:hypothetical protein